LSLIHQSYLQNGGERFYLSFDSDLSNYCEWHSNDINDPDYWIVELEV
jgi:hypothetical protein